MELDLQSLFWLHIVHSSLAETPEPPPPQLGSYIYEGANCEPRLT
jgi:hypothetical protein